MERTFIAWLEQQLASEFVAPEVLVGVGDDGAILQGDPRKQVFVADMIVENVHFELELSRLDRIGHKALAINLSDIAAMGAAAESALVSLALPRAFSLDQAKELMRGILASAARYGVSVLGGDTTRHEGPLMVSVSATGRISEQAKCSDGWMMTGARADDLLVVTGPLGGSILGQHLDFEPRLAVAAAIQERVPVNAATDISDSLSIDLAQLARKSGVGAILDCDQIPLSVAAMGLAKQSGKAPVEHALFDGEDFELLLAIGEDQFRELKSDASFEFPLIAIGRCCADGTGTIKDAKSGRRIEIHGYEHT